MNDEIDSSLDMNDVFEKPDYLNDNNDVDDGRYRVFAVNVKWNPDSTGKFLKKRKNVELPSELTIDIPENVLNQAKKPHNKFEDIIETFVYNTMSRKYEHEITWAQLYLPLDK